MHSALPSATVSSAAAAPAAAAPAAASAAAPLLLAENVSFAARGGEILSGVSFAMRRGEIRAVIGPNGAGKSTLLRCLAGVAARSGGAVRIDGQNLDTLPRRELARKICYLPQFTGRLPAFRVRDYVLMGRYAHSGFWRGMNPGDGERADQALRLAGIEELAERLLPTLSGGERQLAAIAAALAQEAELLILDEPAAFLDPGRQARLLELIRRLNREQGLSLLIVTHDVNAAMLTTTQTLALRNGRVVFDGPSRELAAAEQLERIYGTAFSLLETGGAGRLAFPAGLLRDCSGKSGGMGEMNGETREGTKGGTRGETPEQTRERAGKEAKGTDSP